MGGPRPGSRIHLQDRLAGGHVHLAPQQGPHPAHHAAEARFLDEARGIAETGDSLRAQEAKVPVPQGLGNQQSVLLEAQA